MVQSHVLLVVAEAARRTNWSKALTRAGFSVLAVADPNSAKSLLRIHGHTIRLVILGLALHGAEGLDFASQLAALRPTQEILYLPISPHSLLAEAIRCVKPEAVLPRPFSASELVERVRRLAA